MTDLDDRTLDHGPQGDSGSTREIVVEPLQTRRRPPWLLIAAALGVVALAAYFLFLRDRTPEVAASAPADGAGVSRYDAEATRAGEERVASSAPLPELNASDEVVRQIVGRLSSHPTLIRWLATPELIRTFTVIVENVAIRSSPTRHLTFLAPEGDFSTVQSGSRLTISAGSYERYDLATTVLTSLDPQGCAAAYRQLKPLIEEAFADLGYPRQAFEPTLAQAFANLLAIPIPRVSPALREGISNFTYSDPKLETSSSLEKQLLRLGPGNGRRIQDHLRRLAEALELEL